MEDCKLFECRLCLKILPPNNCSILTEDAKTVLEFLIPEGDVPETSNPAICNICTSVLEKAYKVKEECFSNVEQNKIKTDGTLCFFCRIDNVDEHDEQGDIRAKEVLHICFPNLEFDIKENASCCKSCSKFLEELFIITKECQKTEGDVPDNCLSTGNDNQEADPLGFEYISCDAIKVPEENGSTEDVFDPINAADENTSIEGVKLEAGGKEIATTSKEKQRKRSKEMKSANRYNCASCSYSTNYKSALISHMVSHRTLSEISFRCEICQHETKRKADLRAHMIVHKVPTELKMFKCKLCPYESKRNGDLKQHMLTHRTTIYKCKYCPFETAYEKYLNGTHMLTHKDKSELQFYKCEKCPYQTINKLYFKRHSEIHDFSESFKCNWCAFTTYRKSCLKDHMLSLHTPTSEVDMFKCANCEYQTKRKYDIKLHMVKHMPKVAHSKTVQCEKCNLIMNKKNLTKHMKLHKMLYEIQTYQCYTCGFVTRYKGSIRAHITAKHTSVR